MRTPQVPSVLDAIVAAARRRVEVARERTSQSELEQKFPGRGPEEGRAGAPTESGRRLGDGGSPAARGEGRAASPSPAASKDGRATSPSPAASKDGRATSPSPAASKDGRATSPSPATSKDGRAGSPSPAFLRALQEPGIRVIAECKRRSPSKGVLRHDYDPVSIAGSYGRAGAAAISVLTEPGFFDGHLDHLKAVHAAHPDLPLLRKDFVVDEYQIAEAVVAGASAVLLIVAALEQAELRRLLDYARQVGIDVLTEVHDEDEARRAIDAGATIVGVNNRNLKTLVVSIDTSFRVAPLIASASVRVAESGLRTGADLASLSQAGYGAFLIGERFMTDDDPGAGLAAVIADATQALEARP